MDPKLNAFYDRAVTSYDKLMEKSIFTLHTSIIRGWLGKPLQQLSVLDAGSGTGKVSLMLLEAGVNSMSLLEPAPSMMKIAREKLAQYIAEKKVKNMISDALPDIDLADDTFDVVMMNGVIHLVDQHDECSYSNVEDVEQHRSLGNTFECYPKLLKAFQETYRVLKPGGIIIIYAALPHQMRYCRWYAHFLPPRVASDYPRVLSREQTTSLLEGAGFSDMTSLVDFDAQHIDNQKLNGTNEIEQEKMRAADSSFLRLSDEELQEVIDRVREAEVSGRLEAIMKQATMNRQQMGQETIFVARKPQVN